jgi:(p)ppGpp synthase/HD superfamily hydrolase
MTTTWNQDDYLLAWNFAALAHEGQTYKTSKHGVQVAYINHIGSVAMEVIWALSENRSQYNGNLAIQCALLHDVLEDTATTYEDIQNHFGKAVADGVLALTKNSKLLPKKNQTADSISRIQEQPKEIWMVKLADRITNLAPPPFHWTNDKISSYKEGSMFILESLKDADKNLADRLSSRIEKYNN